MSWGEAGFLAGKIDTNFDVKNYLPLVKIGSFTTGGNAYTSVLSITGAGYLDVATLRTGASLLAGLRITIDGVIVFVSYGIANGFVGGVSRTVDTMIYDADSSNPVSYFPVTKWNNAISYAPINGAPSADYPKIDSTLGACYLTDHLFFKTSLLVEVFASTATATDYRWLVMGGIKV